MIAGARNFVGEVVAEGRKSVWPERQELIESTLVVIVSVVMLSVFVGVSDKLLVSLLGWLIPAG
ncbi:MAG: preprotein translocase subunit SecE [Lentisphaerae bacterium]|nr:preprotein translocase subunit SecE [Lentisphaerota bacterium]